MSTDPASSSTGFLIPFARPEALTDPEKLIAAYFGSSTMGLAILDCEFRYIAINQTLAEMHRVPAADHLGKTVREIMGSFAHVAESALQRVLSSGESLLEMEGAAVFGARAETTYWLANCYPIKDAEGTVTRIAVVAVEITAQRKLERSLQETGQKLRKGTDRMQMLLDVGSTMASDARLQEVFPRISSLIRRVLHQEYAGFELSDPATGLLVRQVEDFPMGKGFLSTVHIRPQNSPGGLAVEQRTALILTRDQMGGFEAEIAKNFLEEGLRSLCCIPILRPTGALGVLVLGSTRDNAFQPDDLVLLNQVAAQFAVTIENRRVAAEIEALKQRVTEERQYLLGDDPSEGHFPEIIGSGAGLKQVLDPVFTVASSEATVLILGETGTGKELVARAVHRLSRRKQGPFIKVNCAAIPTGLLESELFGHEKGAFTGAISQKIGRMELAHGGTLFLDEVGEIPLDLQPKLLRVLQDQEFERLGSNRTIKVNLRLVAATNRDLAKGMAQHEFRSDLFYRLSVFPIRVPPLRERREDIPLMVRRFVHTFSQRMDRKIETIPTETMKSLVAWSWPGNVRELENLMERSVILSDGIALQVPLSELRGDVRNPTAPPDHSLDSAEREHILRVLRETGGMLSGRDGAAHRLGIKRTTLQSKMQRLGITRPEYSPFPRT